MNNLTRLIAASVSSCLAGFVLAALVLPVGFAANAHSSSAHDHSGALPISEQGFYAEMKEVNARMHAGMEIAPSGDVDRDFARMMIPHHAGAIDMARVLLKHGRDERLRRLAQSIIVEQGQEIAYMRTLLDAPS